jgi:hypothetical protein
MKSLWATLAFALIALSPTASAQSFCAQLDGASVYGQDSNGTYLGFFGSRFAPDSIMNNAGRFGSQFGNPSVRNLFDPKFGSRSSNTSANSAYAQKPPLIAKGGQIIALLTANTYLTGGVSLNQIDAQCSFNSASPVNASGSAPPPPPPPPPLPPNVPPVLVDSGFSGLWWNPTRSGEGLNLDFTLVGETTTSLMLVTFYTYDTQGYPIFAVGGTPVPEGQVEATAPVSISEGPRFGPDYDRTQVRSTRLGSLVLRFQTCSRLNLRFVPTPEAEAAGYRGFESQMVRFTPRQPWHDCIGLQ